MGEPLTPEEEAALRRVVAEDVAAVYRSDVAALLATLDAARAAAPAGETDTTPAGDPEMPHVPKPSDICSDCGRGLVHVIPSLDPPAPVQAAGLREAQWENYGDWLVENGLPPDRRAAAVQRAMLEPALLDSDKPGLDAERLADILLTLPHFQDRDPTPPTTHNEALRRADAMRAEAYVAAQALAARLEEPHAE